MDGHILSGKIKKRNYNFQVLSKTETSADINRTLTHFTSNAVGAITNTKRVILYFIQLDRKGEGTVLCPLTV